MYVLDLFKEPLLVVHQLPESRGHHIDGADLGRRGEKCGWEEHQRCGCYHGALGLILRVQLLGPKQLKLFDQFCMMYTCTGACMYTCNKHSHQLSIITVFIEFFKTVVYTCHQTTKLKLLGD